MWPGIRIAAAAMWAFGKTSLEVFAAVRGSFRWRGAVKNPLEMHVAKQKVLPFTGYRPRGHEVAAQYTQQAWWSAGA